MKKLTLLYISLSGNTKYFIENLLKEFNNTNLLVEAINVKDLVKDNRDFFKLNNKFIAFVPTYLDGGNGIDNGNNEILTTPLREFIRHENNFENCLGVIGSGNKNFNNQYCLTAKQYSEEFKIPVLFNFELRGNMKDISQTKNIIINLMEE